MHGRIDSGDLQVLTNPPQVRMCGGTGSRSDTSTMSTAQVHKGRMSNLCLTIVGYWRRLLPQREPASEGAAPIEPSDASETEQTYSGRKADTISESVNSERDTMTLWRSGGIQSRQSQNSRRIKSLARLQTRDRAETYLYASCIFLKWQGSR